MAICVSVKVFEHWAGVMAYMSFVAVIMARIGGTTGGSGITLLD